MCGIEETLSADSSLTQKIIFDNTWHSIELFGIGYGSKLDGCDFKIKLCDDCLYELFMMLSQKAQDRILS